MKVLYPSFFSSLSRYVGGYQMFVDSAYPDTIAHELGHNLGMLHSNTDFADDNMVDTECERGGTDGMGWTGGDGIILRTR
jgi:hypothetical protein